jgi:hypothetical protein
MYYSGLFDEYDDDNDSDDSNCINNSVQISIVL